MSFISTFVKESTFIQNMKAAVGCIVVALICEFSEGNDIMLEGKVRKPFIEEYTNIAETCETIGYIKGTWNQQDWKRKVAFTAAVKASISTWNGGTLIFNTVIANVGDGYNEKTGIFCAPMAGTYVFYISVNQFGNQQLGVDIVLNDLPKVRVIVPSSASGQTGTNMVVLILQKGDHVWVKHSSGKGVNTEGVPLTTFTGFMI